MNKFKIGNKIIGGKKAFIIAEAGVNHNSNIDIALEMVKTAKKCGADAIKFQSFRAEHMCVKTLKETKSVEGVTGGTKSSFDMYKALELSLNDHKKLKKEADEQGILFLSSVFDEPMIKHLVKLGVPAIKISSGDITHKPLIEKAALTKLPIILSTGMATFDEIEKAVFWCKNKGCIKLALLHCIAVYPPKYKDMHIRFIKHLKKHFNVPVGLSDHSPVADTALAAVALGANIIEKHFTLNKKMDGPDHALSLDPTEFTEMVKKIRIVEKSLGSKMKKLGKDEIECRKTGRRGLKAKKRILKGEKISKQNTILIKPVTGISPEETATAYKKIACHTIPEGSAIQWKDLR
ncbi:MAG: N-acetylneuraminate synthase family protein [Candidatus Aureabacteria bacterium]|nr:N-acetylneuraminate synthase family protein [Candidatus Auribacterota bacterium]